MPEEAKNSAGDLFGLGYKPTTPPNIDTMLQGVLGKRPTGVARMFTVADEGEIDYSSHSSVYIDNLNALLGVALSDRNWTNLWELLDPEKLAASYRRTLRLLFALTVSIEMVNPDNGEIALVTRNVKSSAYEVHRLWARALQVGLVVVAVMVALMMALIVQRPCNLDGEPNSIAEALRLLDSSPELVAELENSEFNDPKDLMKVFEEGRGLYRLNLIPERGPRILRIGGAREHAPLPPLKKEVWTEQQWQLRKIFGGAFLAFFGVVAILLLVAFNSRDGYSCEFFFHS